MSARPPLVVAGALAGEHLAVLRDARTGAPAFRRAAAALATLVLAEALRDLEAAEDEIVTPLAVARVPRPARRVTVVPVLRAGLALMQPALDLLPESARVGFLGLSRDERTLEARTYLSNLPGGLGEDEVVVLEVMIATGGSSASALSAVRAAGARRSRLVGLVAAPEGLAEVARVHPDVPVTVAAIDDCLNDSGFIVPGLGDAGDRLFASTPSSR
ncbi:MAG: uracil phosphoribosyltransferase [Thermoleophilia bacterium]